MPPDFSPTTDTLVTDTPTNSTTPRFKNWCGWLVILLAIFVVLTTISWHAITAAPKNSSYPKTLSITSGMGAAAVAEAAKEAGLTRSKLILFALLTKRYDPTQIYAGNYTITEPLSVFDLAATIAGGQTDDTSIRLTFPEGLRVEEVATIAEKTLEHFDATSYIEQATPYEGMLYPETYFVSPDFTAEDVLALQLETFHTIVDPLIPDITAAGRTLEEVLILASIVEREANSPESMKMVAGIFENRLAIGMALQADATIAYILDTPLSELREGELAENLRTIDSPYNTYTHNGLPPTPIANPGITAIDAVINPTPSEYFYYLTDENGDFFYARTLDEHNQNIARYLR